MDAGFGQVLDSKLSVWYLNEVSFGQTDCAVAV